MDSKRLKMDTQTASKGECPVCCQIPRGKIFNICVNGHYLCEACSTKVTICPECRSSGTRVRNLLAERLLDDIEFKCSWSGCDKTMNRGELSAHEDQCDKNPETLQFCSMFDDGKNCQYKFTSTWLTEFENCTEFLKHVTTCVGSCSQRFKYYERERRIYVELGNLIQNTSIAVPGVNLSFKPIFHRVELSNQNKDELFCLIPLLKVDESGNQFVSFAYVQLTPETTPVQVKFTINANPDSRMESQWGPKSLASLNWTQKIIGFKQFVEMVETLKSNPDAEMLLPFSFPVSFISDHYLDKDNDISVNFTLEQIS